MGVWYKEDLRWIVNNPDGDWMQNSCNKKNIVCHWHAAKTTQTGHKAKCHKKKLEIRESKK